MKDSATNYRLEVQAFLMLERIAISKDFLVSVLLQADGKFIGKTSLGTVADGQEIWLSLRWDQPQLRFVASSQAAGCAPVLAFIPFSSPGVAHDMVPPEFSMEKDFTLISHKNSAAEGYENKN